MIALVFSYRRSAALFLVLFAGALAGIVCMGLFVHSVLPLVLGIAAICVGIFVVCLISYAIARHLLGCQIDALLKEDTAEPLQERMRRLTRRAVAGGIKGRLSVEYAYALLYGGAWKDALTAASDALVFAGDKMKPAAYVPMCGAYFGLNEKELFDTFFPRAEHYLQSIRKPTIRTTVSLAALNAMRRALSGDSGAVESLNSIDAQTLPPVLKTALEKFKNYILH